MASFQRVLLITGVLSCTAAIATAAQDVPPIKPGLWQIHMQHDDPEMAARMREMEAQMKAMPPETRKQMESMMKQHGMSMAAPGDMKVCLSKEQLAENGWQGKQDGNCKTDTTRNGNVWKFHSSCPAPHASETEGEATFVSPEHYTMNSTTTMQQGGQPKTMKVSATSKWLGADCGDIKPMQRPKKK